MRGESDGDLLTPVCSEKGKPKGKFGLMGGIPFDGTTLLSSMQKCECDLSYRMNTGRRTMVNISKKSLKRSKKDVKGRCRVVVDQLIAIDRR